MENSNQNAQQTAEAQNESIRALAEVFSNILSRLSDLPVKPEDLTIKTGSNKIAWPLKEGQIEDITIKAKIKDAVVNNNPKVSFRIYLEYPDGSKEMIFRQAGGKIDPDTLGLAPALRSHFAQEAAEKAAAKIQPKIRMEVEGPNISTSTERQEPSIVQPVKDGNLKPLTDEEIAKKIAEFSAKLDPDSATKSKQSIEKTIKTPIQDTPEVPEVPRQIQIEDEDKKVFFNNPRVELAYNTANLQLQDVMQRSQFPGMEYLLKEAWVTKLQVEVDTLKQQLQIGPAVSATAKIQSSTDQLEKLVKNGISKAAFDNAGIPDGQYKQLYLSSDPRVINGANPTDQIMRDSVVSQAALNMGIKPDEFTRILAEGSDYVRENLDNKMTFEGNPSQYSVGLDYLAKQMTQYQNAYIEQNQSASNFTLFSERADQITSNSVTEHIPTFPTLSSIDDFTGNTIDILPIPNDFDSASNAVSIQPFLQEVKALSIQISEIRQEANLQLSALSVVAAEVIQKIQEPKFDQWKEQIQGVVTQKTQSWTERLKEAAERAVSDIAITKGYIKEQFDVGTDAVISYAKDRIQTDIPIARAAISQSATNVWEATQRLALDSPAVDRAINQVLLHSGEGNQHGAIASVGGYDFVKSGDKIGIFRSEDKSPVYRDGLMAPGTNAKDSAFVASVPYRAAQAVSALESARGAESSNAPVAAR